MESKKHLEVGDTVYVLHARAEVWDLVPSNTAMIKVLMKEGPSEGQVFPVVLKQVERG
ncbi:hypothetical protein KNV00_gp166 [Streptomyces phage Bmoc]|uniref:Uncharacterized protein n=1 Tax=Streptomyces phage Bmoc TaxID=2725629 RepID=A0A6M3SXY0_9CAUD|nr:hypothetical protein KNV00_gp166 [Streptomyces phage Bmoc]QJD50853.1 hypothetical protein SEA_BMOC_111 [Streptomyces phage Bmoc]